MAAKFQLPPLFQSAALKDVDPQQFGFVLDYRKNLAAMVKGGVGLVVSGPPGTGKSYTMAALSLEYAKRARAPGSWHFETVPELLEKYRPMSVGAPTDEFRGQSWTTTYEKIRWLVLNDMGKEYRGGKMHEQHVAKLGRLIRQRTEQGLVTHVTTNLPLYPKPGVQRFEAVYGASLWSLLHEKNMGFDVWGPDRRIGEGEFVRVVT